MIVAVFGAAFIALALRLARSNELDRRPAHRLFAFSILYLFVLFAALFADNSGDRSSRTVSAYAAPASVGPVDAPLWVTRGSTRAKLEGR
jgi:protoheme IX farnesyltransferase